MAPYNVSTQPLNLYKSESPSPKIGSYQVWLKLAWWFLRRSRLKEKLTPDRRQTDGPAPWHKLSWPVARWANTIQYRITITSGRLL